MPLVSGGVSQARTGSPRRQVLHTAKRISKRLRDEHGYGVGLTAVEDYVLIAWERLRETFRPCRGNAVGVSCGSVR